MTRTKSLWRNAKLAGTASIEFALLAPVFVVILFGGVDTGMFMAQESLLVAAARAGSEYVRVVPSCIVTVPTFSLCKQATSFVQNYTGFPGMPGIIMSASLTCTCADNSKETASCPPTGLVSPCAGVTANGDARVFVYGTVGTDAKGYKSMLRYEHFGTPRTSSTIRSQ